MPAESDTGSGSADILWYLDHPEESLVGYCRTFDKLRVACTIGITGGVILVLGTFGMSGVTWLIPLGFTALLGYIRWDLPSTLRSLESTINLMRTRELPDTIEPGDVISVYAYRNRVMPESGNVLLCEVEEVNTVEMLRSAFERDMFTTPAMATEENRKREAETLDQTVGTVRVLSEPIWETEQLVSGEVRQGDLGYFFVEDDLALLAGKAESQ